MRRRRAVFAGAGVYLATWLVNRSLRRVEGGSMRPTLQPGDLVVVVPARIVPVRRGSVVVVPDPRDGRTTIKRVAALAGDEVVVHGDDPTASTDSRHYGAVRAASVGAVAVLALRRGRFPIPLRPVLLRTGTR